MHRGYIKLWRKLLDNPLWTESKFTRGQAWVDLLMIANHKPGHIRKRGIKIDIETGEIGWSERELASRWKWSRGKVRRFLSELCFGDDSFLVPQNEPQNSNVTSRYKIRNWDKYQSSGTTERTTNGPQTDRKRYQNKNEKNEKNIKILSDPQKKTKRKTKLPDDFPLTENLREYAIKLDLNKNIERVFDQFCDYHRAKGSGMVDWNAAWRTWVRNEIKFSSNNRGTGPLTPKQQGVVRTLERLNRRM